MPNWLRRIVARLLLLTMVIGAAGLTFGCEILEDGPTTGPESVISTASASQDDNPSQGSGIAAKACDPSCHSTSHFLGQLPAHASIGTPEPTRQYVPRDKPLLARDHTENPFRPPRYPA